MTYLEQRFWTKVTSDIFHKILLRGSREFSPKQKCVLSSQALSGNLFEAKVSFVKCHHVLSFSQGKDERQEVAACNASRRWHSPSFSLKTMPEVLKSKWHIKQKHLPLLGFVYVCACTIIWNFMKKSLLSCSKNVMKNFTVWSNIAGVVILVLSTDGLRDTQKGLAQPSLEGTGTHEPLCPILTASSHPPHPCLPFCVSQWWWLHHIEARLGTFPLISEVNLSLTYTFFSSNSPIYLLSSSANSNALLRLWKKFCKGHSCSDFVPA